MLPCRYIVDEDAVADAALRAPRGATIARRCYYDGCYIVTLRRCYATPRVAIAIRRYERH